MNPDDLIQEVEALRREVRELRSQVEALARPPVPTEAKVAEGVDEETMLVLSAAVAAYLGKRATIKLVRPVHEVLDGWRVQGRVAIHGSHSRR